MNCRNNQIHGMIVIFICAIILISIMMPVIAQGGNNSGKGSENHDDGNKSPHSEPDNSPNNPSNGENHGQQNQMQNNRDKSWCGYQKRYQHRKMNCTGGHNQSRIRSQWRLNNSIDAFEIEFTIDPEPVMILYYMPDGNTSNVQLTFKITLKKLVEFADLNNNGRFDYIDSEISTYAFENVNFTNITYSNETLISGETVLTMETQTFDNVFEIKMYISDNFTSFNKQILSPSEMKIDFQINQYPFLENNTPLALIMEITTNHNLSIEAESFDEKQGYAFNESAVNISSMHYSGFLSWLNTVSVDGINKSIQASILEEEHPGMEGVETIRFISFSYPHGAEIIHDPKIGVVSQSFNLAALNNVQLINIITDLNVYFTYIISCVLAIIIFIGILSLRKRL